jgi:hypothetical protein
MAAHATFTKDSVFQRDPATLEASVGTETVLCSSESGLFCHVNAVGSRIWALLERPRSIAEIVSGLRERYAVNQATCLHEIQPFLATLEEAHLISPVTAEGARETLYMFAMIAGEGARMPAAMDMMSRHLRPSGTAQPGRCRPAARTRSRPLPHLARKYGRVLRGAWRRSARRGPLRQQERRAGAETKDILDQKLHPCLNFFASHSS